MTVYWPSIREPHPDLFLEKFVLPAHRTPTSAGKTFSRPQFSSGRWEFSLGWDALSDTDYGTLVTFFGQYQGQIFVWTHFKKGTAFNCIFLEDALPEFKPVLEHWIPQGQVKIGER